MKVAIHQPNFLPWYPYFLKMEMVDLFIFLDDVQFEKNGFTNRVKLDEDHWLTLPVEKGLEPINYKRIDKPDYNLMKIKKRLIQNYPLAYEVIEMAFLTKWLVNFNVISILALVNHLGIDTDIMFSSALDVPLRSGDKLAEIVNRVGGTHYVSGMGGKNYLDTGLFEEKGIVVEFKDFKKTDKKFSIINYV